MADPPDYDELARRYLDLWQDQAAAAAADPDLAEQAAALFRAMAGGAVPGMAGMLPWAGVPGFPPPGGAGGDRGAGDGAGTPAGAPAAAAAPADGDRVLARLADRLADVEARLAVLEAGGSRPAARRGGRAAAPGGNRKRPAKR